MPISLFIFKHYLKNSKKLKSIWDHHQNVYSLTGLDVGRDGVLPILHVLFLQIGI